MNKLTSVTISTCIFFCSLSCTKDNQKPTVNQETVNIHVEEYLTKAPLAGATISLVKYYIDYSCFCQMEETYLTKQTDQNGDCQILKSDFDEPGNRMYTSKDSFWSDETDTGANKETRIELQKMGQVWVHIVKTNNYPVLSNFHIDLSGAVPGSVVKAFSSVPLPSDTTITMAAFGGQTNRIHWKVVDNGGADSLGGGHLDVDVLHDGVTDVQINY
jgi:hypothetical protein